MYCPKCGKKLPKNATLCATCDQDKIQEYLASQQAAVEAPTETVTETPEVEETKTEEVVEEPVVEETKEEVVEETIPEETKEEVTEEAPVEQPAEEVKTEEVVTPVVEKPVKPKKERNFKWVKYVVIILVLAVLAVVGYFAYGKVVGFEKLSWDKEYGDYKLEVVTPNELKLAFDFTDEENYDQVKVKATCGSVKVKRNKITWDLTEASGDCKIEAKYKTKKITKKIKVVDSYQEKRKLSIEYIIDEYSDEDLEIYKNKLK